MRRPLFGVILRSAAPRLFGFRISDCGSAIRSPRSLIRNVMAAFAGLSLLAIFAIPVLAAPGAQEPRPVIAQPEQDSAVRGIVQVVGSAVHPQFQRYELYYAPWPVPSDGAWVFIGDAHYQAQPLGLLGTWDSRSVPDGTYALRVRVVKQDGNYNDSDPRRVLVVNTRQLDTPTPAATEQPTEAPALPPTATVVIEAPTITLPQAPTPEFTPTPEPDVTPSPTPLISSGASSPPGLDQMASRLLETAKTAATYTVGFFLAVGAFFAVKALLYWIWQRVRP
jgi:hypothetical protein